MKLYSWLSPSAERLSSMADLGLLLLLSSVARAQLTSIPSPNLDLGGLGSIILAGDYEGISLYEYEGQNEDEISTNGSQSVLSRYPNGGFVAVESADAAIRAMCPFTSNGTFHGVIVGGNFTSLGGVPSQGVAIFNPTTSTVEKLVGLSGQVSALLCDGDTVYVGGNFIGLNSTNAIAWVGTAGWTDLPFGGLNGPVTSISKASNGHIIFGGSFTGLGNATAPTLPDLQIINISGGNITSGSSSSTTGFSDPRNIVCKTNGTDEAGSTWLLADNTAGFWEASFRYGFRPTKLRLWNTHQNGRGTKTWRYTALPMNGIMNFTYIDPATKQNTSCASECPLSNDTTIEYQDFHFVNIIGMNEFRIDISAWYGSGGGLDGIELFEDDIFAYAIESFNEPNCTSIELASTSTNTGPWIVTPSQQSISDYLTAKVSDTALTSVTFQPDIKQSGNYTVNIYTPGCIQDDSCATRGRVNITLIMSSDADPVTDVIFQTNNFDKYDQLYFGQIEAGDDTFRASVILSPVAADQSIANYSIVAQRVGFSLMSASVGLNNLLEYDPSQADIDTTELTNSTFTKAGTDLGTSSEVNTLITSGSTTFVGGNFTTDTVNNVFSITGSDITALAGGGLNGAVVDMFLNGSVLYVGGQFTNTSTGGVSGLNNIASYDTSKKSWSALGAGVNGKVNSVVPLSLNVTANVPETVITLTGDFSQIMAFSSNNSQSVTGFAIWVPSKGNWLQNLPGPQWFINGQLTAAVDVPGGATLFAGSVSSSQLLANGAVALTQAGALNSLPVSIQATTSTSSLTKRATSSQNVTGVVTGLFNGTGDQQVIILGGHFTATTTNGSTVNNLIVINNQTGETTGIGLSSDLTILSLAVEGNTLFAGGSDGLITYNLATNTSPTQPPALAGGTIAVNAISVRPDSTDVYVAGSFSDAGALDCPAVCLFSTSLSQWTRPGATLSGDASVMLWASSTTMIVGGSLSISGANASLVSYNSKKQEWTAVGGAASIPGPVVVMTNANDDASSLWVAGTATNGSTFLMKSSGDSWTPVGAGLGAGTVIRGLQLFEVTEDHAKSDLVSSGEVLMISGALVLDNFGNASSALYNGTTFQPFALTTSSSGGGGSLSQSISSQQTTLTNTGGHVKVGYIILIGLAISLGIIFLLVLAGIIAERIRIKRQGYIPAPTSSYDRGAAMSRMPPQQLFGSIGQSRSGIEKQSTLI
ncbi:cortical protein marker for cell polarity-domain-containing protein [Calycina marina]|uniref:Cortical protein marker for cell polarity-domain-containing protein n=1 Tax=Calycina marina TaxID=1763456 RepID=A0A9P7Z5Z6_9HELO|nr:cortical protein marker for cell polarity-domain-containing protein [Calycina marina]